MAGSFTTVSWAATANIYEINLRQYTKEGTFAAFQKELPRLRDMGIDVLWFMPLTPISLEQRQGTLGSYYAANNYTQLNAEFGDAIDFKALMDEAHALGFKVLIDWVANHTGFDHVWTKEHPEFYKKNEDGDFFEANGWIDVIDLDYENAELRKAMIDAMKHWVTQFDVDGFRCDMAHLVPLDFWQQARAELDNEKKLFWLAECEVPEYHRVFDATYTWLFLHTAERLYRGEASVFDLENVLEQYQTQYPSTALRLYFTSNHDENSHSGSEYQRLGNAAKAFAVFTMTSQNSLPLIYSGQEMPNKKQLKFFDRDAIEWTGQYLLHDFYKTLLTLRKTNPAMRAGDDSVRTVRIKTSADTCIYAFQKRYGESKILVMLNLSHASKLKIQLTDPEVTGQYTSVFSGLRLNINEDTLFEMQAWEYLVFVVNVQNG
jgi:alpha-amylase